MKERVPPLDGVRVLVVDDDAIVREVVERLLAAFGSKVTAVAGASEALEALSWAPPDVGVSDIEMPGENGYSPIRKDPGIALGSRWTDPGRVARRSSCAAPGSRAGITVGALGRAGEEARQQRGDRR
jgi:hypothetical protein